MAKKTTAPKVPTPKSSSSKRSTKPDEPSRLDTFLATLPKDAQKSFSEIKTLLESYQKALQSRKDPSLKGLALLPPAQKKEGEKIIVDKDAINLLILYDDRDQKNPKAFIDEKIKTATDLATKTSPRLKPYVTFTTQLWSEFSDGKYDLAQQISMSMPFYDHGYLDAIKIGEIHKSMVIKKFEKYIVSYVLAGSLIQGRATEKSDIDVFIVIDDTDVKRMSRIELKEKLRSIIISMGIEAGDMTGIRNKLNVQVYILTDFWANIRDANPIIFTFLRDGVPLYDRGTFMPWKLLLHQGRIKPSQEAIEMYMSSGSQVLTRAKYKLKEIGMEDTFWAILYPSQAALMLYGIPPPTPRETPELMREIFVKKEKLLEEKYVIILEKNIQLRKELEHGDRKELSGKEADALIKDAESYLKRIDDLFEKIHTHREGESLNELIAKIKTAGGEKTKLYAALTNKEKRTKQEQEKLKREAEAYLRELAQKEQTRAFELHKRSRITIQTEKQHLDVYAFEDNVYVVERQDGRVTKSPYTDGVMGDAKETDAESLEKALLTPAKGLTTQLITQLEKRYGAITITP